MSEGKNPFPGLRPFEYHEYELFFGREEQYEEMIDRLSETRFLAVVGTSGSGKSSLVKAGLLPALYGGHMLSAGPEWRVAEFRPKDDPIRELALALNHKRVFGDNCKDDGCSDFKLTESTNWVGLCARVRKEANGKECTPSGRILEVLPEEKRSLFSDLTQNGDPTHRSKIIQVFNGLLERRDFYQDASFQSVPLSKEIKDLLDQKSLTNEEIQKLNRLLLEASFPQEIAKKIESQAQITEVTLRRGDLGLIEVAREAKMPAEENLLVVVDQFEELFRYAKISEHGPHGNQAAAFVKLLLAASAQHEIPIYVVLTMRSDYLGDCAKFWGLPEAINKGQYLIPRLTRDQRREAIKGPIGLRGAKITAQLVNQLLNDMGDDPDQLPILQHALMRTWDQWEKDHGDGEPIDVRHYEAIGRMAEALSLHADEAYNELSDDRSREIAEKMFKCLTEKGMGHSETRRPTSVDEILAVTGAEAKELVSVINVFRREGRSFLLPAARKPLKREALIDISHESLIRNWKRLKDWVKEETESANVYRRLVETATLYQQGKAGTLTDLEIDHALKWKEKNKPNLAWASPYHLDLAPASKTKAKATNGQPVALKDQEIFDATMGFLNFSKTKSRIRKFTKIAVAASIFLIAIMALALWMYFLNKESRLKTRLTYNAEINLAQGEFEVENFAAVNRLLLQDSDDVKQEFNIKNSLTWGLPFWSPNKISSLRNFEWRYLWKRSHDEIRTLAEYDSQVISVSYLDKFNTVAVATRNGRIMFWDVAQDKELAKTQGAPPDPTTIAFASDCKNVVIGRKDGSIEVWELSDDLQKLTWRRSLRDRNINPVNSTVYSPDNSILAFGTQDGLITLLRPAENQPFVTQLIGNGPISLAFSRDSRLLAIGRDQTVIVIDVTKPSKSESKIDLNSTLPKEVRDKGGLAAPITCLAFSPDRNTLAIGTKGNSITLWDMTEKTYMISMASSSSADSPWEISAVAFSDEAKGVLASTSTDGSIKIWDAKLLSDLGFRRSLTSQGIALDSLVATEISQRRLLLNTLKGHAGAVTAMAFTPKQETIISGSEDKTIKSWELTESKRSDYRLRSTSPSIVSSVAFSPNGKWLAVGNSDLSLSVWNTDDKQSQGTFLRSSASGQSMGMPIAFSKDQILAAATDNNSVTLWQMNNQGEALRKLSGAHSRPVLALAFSTDGKWLATGGADGKVLLWNVNTGEWTSVESIDKGAALSLAFSSTNTAILAIGTSNNNVILWDLDRKNKIGELNGHSDVISSIAFSPDGDLIATGSWDRSAKLWNAHTGKELLTLQGHFKKVLSIAFLPTGRRLVTSSEDGSVRFWDASYEEIGEKSIRSALVILRDPESGAAPAVATSPDGLTLATGNGDGTVLLRYGATDEEIAKQTKRIANHVRSPE